MLRVPVIGLYSRTFHCDVNEAEIEDLRSYKNLGDFFRRALKPGIRPVSKDAVVSPADGIVVHYGKANNEWIEQVKGVNYSLKSFLGPLSWNSSVAVNETEKQDDIDKAYHEQLRQKKNEKTSLYQCVIYLAPGDYHRFHSPADWTVSFRRHFSGKLISIRPSFMSWISDLFSLNERVAYLGTWAYGFFSMTAVGATNVGSIKVYFDEVSYFLHHLKLF